MPSEPIVVGFDPGVNGGVAWVQGGRLLHVADIPNLGKKVNAPVLYRMLLERPADVASIELLNAMPKMNPTALFKLGEAHGICLGVTADLPLVNPLPRTWKAHFGITGARKDQKTKARQLATQRWPGFSMAFQRVKDADRAEAALIALYACEVGA